MDTSELAAQVYVSQDNTPQAEIYDSGCSKHLTPYRNALTNFISISPKSFYAANKQSMNAIGMGEMVIDIPNGVNTTKLRLTEVLYSPEVGYTLISIGKLNDNGYQVTFSSGKCIIRDAQGETIGSIPKIRHGLYKVVQDEYISANAVEETLTLNQFHRRMGHISPKTAHHLIEKGLVTGIHLEPNGDQEFFCESCVYAKATHLSVPKNREGSRTIKFSDKVHLCYILYFHQVHFPTSLLFRHISAFPTCS